MIGDLKGESLILQLLRKILQLEAPFSLIEDTEDSFNEVILIVILMPIFCGIRTEDADCTLRVINYSFPFSFYHIVNVRGMPSSVKRTSYRL